MAGIERKIIDAAGKPITADWMREAVLFVHRLTDGMGVTVTVRMSPYQYAMCEEMRIATTPPSAVYADNPFEPKPGPIVRLLYGYPIETDRDYSCDFIRFDGHAGGREFPSLCRIENLAVPEALRRWMRW